jgi:hypothetical protein
VQTYRLKNWSAAEREARLPAMSASSREISSCISYTRAASSSTESKLKSCPISWVIFFFGLSSSSIAAMVRSRLGTYRMIPKSGNRFSEKIMRKRKKSLGCHIGKARLDRRPALKEPRKKWLNLLPV